ncbi:MAG: hypothetical protein ACI9ZT_002215 [Gammaproteobacteria bacterium]|jgi:hypothetical protein
MKNGGNVYWLFSLLVTTFLWSQPTASEQHGLFEVSDLSLTEPVDDEVIPAFITNPKQASLIVRQVTKDHERSLRTFSLTSDGRYGDGEINNIQIDKDIIFMDIGKVRNSPLDYIILFRRNAAWWFDPVSGKEHHLLDIQSIYKNVIKDELPNLDVVKDINGDSLEDIMLPGFDGYQLFLQTSPGVFAEPILIDALPSMRASNSGNNIRYRYQDRNLVDVNFDQKNDILIWEAPDLRAFLQTEEGSFYPEQQLVPLGIELEGAEEVEDRLEKEDQSDIQARTFHKISDINADQLPDLVTISITSKGVLNKSTTYEFFMGSQSPSQVLNFPDQPNTQIRSNGIQFDAQEKDFNNDGMTDFIISSVELGFWKIVNALLRGSILIDLDFYQLSQSGYPDKPNITHKIKATYSLSSGKHSLPSVLIVDVNGDQLIDLLVQDDDALQLSYGDGSDGLFESKTQRFDVLMPAIPDLVDTFDLNKDDKMDIILRYQDNERGMEKVVKVLLAN